MDLYNNVYKVTFIKSTNQEERTMICTSRPDLVPETSGSGGALPKNLVVTYDLENSGFRSFYKDKVIEAKKVDWEYDD